MRQGADEGSTDSVLARYVPLASTGPYIKVRETSHVERLIDWGRSGHDTRADPCVRQRPGL